MDPNSTFLLIFGTIIHVSVKQPFGWNLQSEYANNHTDAILNGL